MFTVKQEEHIAVKLRVQNKLASIANIISQAIQDGEILSIEFYKLVQEIEKCSKFKTDIRKQAKSKARKIAKNSEKNCSNKTERKANIIFYKKPQILQVFRVSVLFKV